MYPAPFHYHRPASVLEAVDLLARSGGAATVLAGGQSLIPMMKLRLGEFPEIIDIGRLPELSSIERRGDTLHIGALARHAQIALAAVTETVPILRDVAGGIADCQIRTMGTIGGGLCIADPSGCWPNGLRAVGARVVCTGPQGVRTVAVEDLIVDSYTTCLADDELLTEVQIPLPAVNTGSAYVAYKRTAATYPAVAVGASVTIAADKCTAVRLVLSGAGSTTIVSPPAEALLVNTPLDEAQLAKAAEIIVAASDPPPDARGSEAFKRAMLRSLVVEAVARAHARARGENVTKGHRYA